MAGAVFMLVVQTFMLTCVTLMLTVATFMLGRALFLLTALTFQLTALTFMLGRQLKGSDGALFKLTTQHKGFARQQRLLRRALRSAVARSP